MYNHQDLEREILDFWKKENIYEKAKARNQGNEPFYYCDGPPYATGQIHPGTGWNKTIKDAFCRFYRMSGRDVRFQPGYDTHGLPIEVKVERELKFEKKADIEKYGVGKFVDECKKFATKYTGVMAEQFASVGVWMDHEAPYITYHDSYISSSWQTIKMAHEKGLLYEDVYVLPYCYRCETTLANYELEYDDETDPSVFVKFKIKGTENEYLVIWTTTPWTLVANMAVMAHPTFSYVKVKVDDEVWILAKERLNHLMGLTEKSAVVLEELPGRKLKDIEYLHPFQDKINKSYDRKVVLTDEFVTLEDGSGLVHAAPGHGPADFIIGKRFDIEAFCPVDGRGVYNQEAGQLANLNVREANPKVIEILKSNGSLVYEARISHRYPHCWRCKTPLIFITTKQWFIAISKIKDQMLAEIEATDWQPDFAKERFREFVSGAPDWCISRQRYWGIPLPIWKCASCEKVRVVGSKQDLPQVKELHRPYLDEIELSCECGGKSRRVRDVLDVWFDSGNAVWASLSAEDAKKFGEIANLIIEGQDQIRGWFYSLLGSGVIRYNKCPYKRLLMHGFFVDEHGEKMSKSLGNFIPLEEILKKYGSDSFRLWGASNTTWDEIKFSWVELKKCNSDLNIASNLVIFLERFYPKKRIEETKLTKLDEWMLSRLNSTLKEYRSAFESLQIHRAAKVLRTFLVEDVSRFYMKLAKDRISNQQDDQGALYVLYHVMLGCLRMLGCISPMISEHLYQMFFRKYEGEESVFLLGLLAEDDNRINSLSENQVEIIREVASVAMVARQTAGVKLRWPVRTLYVETSSHEVTDALNSFSDALLSLLNAKEVKVISEGAPPDVASAPFSNGSIHILKKIDEELYEEGMLNEIKRRIQMMRKQANLVEQDHILLSISSEAEIEGILKKQEKKLVAEVNASQVSYGPAATMEEYTIDGRLVRIAITKEN